MLKSKFKNAWKRAYYFTIYGGAQNSICWLFNNEYEMYLRELKK